MDQINKGKEIKEYRPNYAKKRLQGIYEDCTIANQTWKKSC